MHAPESGWHDALVVGFREDLRDEHHSVATEHRRKLGVAHRNRAEGAPIEQINDSGDLQLFVSQFALQDGRMPARHHTTVALRKDGFVALVPRREHEDVCIKGRSRRLAVIRDERPGSL